MKKRILALALSFSLMSTYAVYASPAENLAQLGVIQASTSGYNEASQITRAEFMVILSKLYGETSVTKYSYNGKFTDVKSSDWFAPYVQFATDKNITSGLTATTFGPNSTLTYEQASLFLNKVLGYNVPFDKALTTAYELNLVKGITVKLNTPITRGDLFVMAENALNTSYNGDAAPLKQKLGLGGGAVYRNQTAMAAYDLVGVKAVSNSLIEVTFNKAPGYLLKEEVSVTGTTVKQVTAMSDKVFLIEVEAKALTTVEVKIGKSMTTTGKAEDKGKFIAIASSSKAVNAEQVVLQFNKPVHPEVLTNKALIKVDNNLEVKSVAFAKGADGSFDYNKLVVRTSPQADGKLYSMDLKALKDQYNVSLLGRASGAEFMFGGVAEDKTAPKVERAIAKTNKEVIVSFSEMSSLEEATALDKNNYLIKTADKGEAVYIESVVPKLDAFGQFKEVTLITENLYSGTGYMVEVKNVKDVFGNTISKDFDFRYGFASKPKDSDRPKIQFSNNTSANQIKLVFNEGVTKASAENVSNYVFDSGITVKSAKLSESDDTVVFVETNDQPTGKSFVLYVSGVTDYSGNAMTKNDAKLYFFGNGGDQTKPVVLSADPQIMGGRSVVVVSYSKDMVLEDILNKENYDFGSLGKALYVEKINDRQVKVYTEDHVKFQSYTMTVSNVKDSTGIQLNGSVQTITFFGAGL